MYVSFLQADAVCLWRVWPHMRDTIDILHADKPQSSSIS